MKAVQVLETNVLHASDVIYWLDGSSAAEPAHMLRVDAPLALQLTTRPRDMQLVSGPGKTALLRRPTGEMVNGRADDIDKARPVTATFPVAGVVSDESGRFVPRRFQVAAGNGAGHWLIVYPSPLASRFTPTGGLLGSLRFDTSQLPVPWAILTLVVATAPTATLTFRCQASGSGDFAMPLRRLPPLPEGVNHFPAALSIRALPDARGDTPVDPDDLVGMNLGDTADGSFAPAIDLRVVPGKIDSLRTHALKHLAVRAG